MSHIRFATCPLCHHLISTGWTEPGMSPAVFCGACDVRLVVSPWDATCDRRPADLELTSQQRRPTEVTSRRGRVRRTPLRLTPVVSEHRVPLEVELQVTPGGTERLVWRPDFSAIPCPGCGTVGRIRDWHAAVERCPRCEGGPMEVDDP
jgi:hypothetical protein